MYSRMKRLQVQRKMIADIVDVFQVPHKTLLLGKVRVAARALDLLIGHVRIVSQCKKLFIPARAVIAQKKNPTSFRVGFA
jgi:hypothetical protein